MKDDLPATLDNAILPHSVRLRHIQIPNCTLVVEDGRDAGKSYVLGEHTSIGRQDWCDIGLDDPRVSKEHCELVWTPEGMVIRDLGSTNGVEYYNGRIKEMTLTGNCRFKIGGTHVRVEFGDGSRKQVTSPSDATHKLLGASLVMKRLFFRMERLARANVPILLLGETGTGKTAIAEVMHQMSGRTGEFVPVDCPAINHNLFESALFGYVRGAYTGADHDVEGVFEQANGGSVFLDEIAEIPLELQAKLLTVIESRMVRRQGSRRTVRSDFRLYCATNRDLAEEVRQGRFRRDLFERLDGMTLTVPPLRERVGDVAILADWFTYDLSNKSRALREHCPVTSISKEAIELLDKYHWPGNVRELMKVIARTIVFTESPCIQPGDLLMKEGGTQTRSVPPPETPPPNPGTLENARIVADREHIESLLKYTNGNVTKAAQVGGISLSHLKDLIKRLGIRR